MADYRCRFYENKYPKIDDLVMVRVNNIADMGAYVSLLEYDQIEGMILFSELSRKRIRSISKHISVGRQEVAMVLRVDEEKGYIDLSKRRVQPEDIATCEAKYNKSKAVHSILRHVAETLHLKLPKLYEQIGWPLYAEYGHAYEAFKEAVSDPDKILKGVGVEGELKEELLRQIQMRLKPQVVKIRADIELTCFSIHGIDGVRAALKAGEAVGPEDMPVQAKLVAPPEYVLLTSSSEKEPGIECINKALEAVKAKIAEFGGDMIVKKQARAVGEREHKKFNSESDSDSESGSESESESGEEETNSEGSEDEGQS